MTVIENSHRHRGSLDFSATLKQTPIQVRIGMDMCRHADAHNCPTGTLGLAASFQRSGLTDGYSARRANGRSSGFGEEARYQPASLCPLDRQAGVQRARHQSKRPRCHRLMGTRKPPLPYLPPITGFPFTSLGFFILLRIT